MIINLLDGWKKVSKHKVIEYQIYLLKRGIELGISINYAFGKDNDHHGIWIDINLLVLVLTFSFYDSRHYEDIKEEE